MLLLVRDRWNRVHAVLGSGESGRMSSAELPDKGWTHPSREAGCAETRGFVPPLQISAKCPVERSARQQYRAIPAISTHLHRSTGSHPDPTIASLDRPTASRQSST